jgi:hypothetical protein
MAAIQTLYTGTNVFYCDVPTEFFNIIHVNLSLKGGEGTQWRSWLRHCVTSRKVAGSFPDGVIEIFHQHNPSGRTMPWD